ncbi:hypothetical protein ZWY2020_036488, partial [Hordeum vulgare]
IHHEIDHVVFICYSFFAEELIALDIAIHPRHEKKMRPYQLAGFHFLVRNIVSDKPGSSILAHAPEMSEVDAEDRASSLTDVTVDSLVQSINVADGVKARFFTDILELTNSAGENVLAFSWYIYLRCNFWRGYWLRQGAGK